MQIDTSPKRLRELAATLWVTATSDDRLAAHYLLRAIAAEKEAQNHTEQTPEMVAGVPLPEPEFAADFLSDARVYRYIKLLQYGRACAKAARDTAFNECGEIVQGMHAEIKYVSDPIPTDYAEGEMDVLRLTWERIQEAKKDAS